MPKPEYAEIEIRVQSDILTAWIGGKYLGVVHSRFDGVYISLNCISLSRAGMKMKSAAALQESIEHSEGGTSSLC